MPPLCEKKETSWVPDPWHEMMIFRLRRPWFVVFKNILKEEKKKFRVVQQIASQGKELSIPIPSVCSFHIIL